MLESYQSSEHRASSPKTKNPLLRCFASAWGRVCVMPTSLTRFYVIYPFLPGFLLTDIALKSGEL